MYDSVLKIFHERRNTASGPLTIRAEKYGEMSIKYDFFALKVDYEYDSAS